MNELISGWDLLRAQRPDLLCGFPVCVPAGVFLGAGSPQGMLRLLSLLFWSHVPRANRVPAPSSETNFGCSPASGLEAAGILDDNFALG